MINKIDFLSPPITLFHLERRTHTSKFGALLVIFLIIMCLSYTFFLLFNLINHKKMTYIFYKKFEFEAGLYSFNSSSVFHFIQIFSADQGGYFDKFDSKYIRAYTTYAHSNLSYDNVNLYDHWVFDTCRKNIDDKDLDSSLFQNVENFTNGVCIRYYFNSLEKKYYIMGDNGFKWPYLEHGIAQRKNIYLTTIVQKCSNDSITNEIFGKCPPQKEIDDYLEKYFGIYLYFTDTQVDPTNFEDPVTQYLQVVSTGIGNSQTYVESYIHFSPLRVKTVIGSVFGETHDINSFYFDFNRKGAANNAGSKYFTITRYYHLMQNNVQIYERRYNNIFDIFSEIGGIAQFIFYLFYWINYIYNKFVIDFDTNYLFFSIKDSNPINNQNNNNNNNIKISNISNKIKINGNDNRVYNIQNNFLKVSKRDSKKYRNSKFYINESQKAQKNNNCQDIGIFFKTDQLNKLENSSLEKKNNYNMLIRRERTISANKIMIDNSRDVLYNLNQSKDFIGSVASQRNSKKYSKLISSDYNKRNIKIINRDSKDNPVINIDIKRNIDEKENKKKKSNKSLQESIINVPISKISINQINYRKQNPINLNDEIIKRKKSFSILLFTKSMFFKKEKQNNKYLTLFRKHLLSEEHLLKSHINYVLLEKKYNLNDNVITNIYECYNEL